MPIHLLQGIISNWLGEASDFSLKTLFLGVGLVSRKQDISFECMYALDTIVIGEHSSYEMGYISFLTFLM